MKHTICKYLLLVAVLGLLISACGYVPPETKTIANDNPITRIENLAINQGLTRFEDTEAGVVCWALLNKSYLETGIGLSCLPKASTTLK